MNVQESRTKIGRIGRLGIPLAVAAGICAGAPAAGALAGAPAAGAVPVADEESWYALRLQDKPIGWAHMTQQQGPDRISTGMTIHIELRRAAFRSVIHMSSRFDETPRGEPLEHVMSQKIGLLEQKQTTRYGPEGIEIVADQAGQTSRQVVPMPEGSWLTPAAAARYIERQIAAGADEISFRSVDPMVGPEPFESVMRRREAAPVEVMGKFVPAIGWDVTVSVVPGIVSRLYTDERGRDVKTSVNVLPGISFELILADEQVARARIDPPELMGATLIRPDGVIPQPRGLRRAVFELRLGEQAGSDEKRPAPLAIPEMACQRVVHVDRGAVIVTVALDGPKVLPQEAAGPKYLQASSMLNHEDEVLRGLVRRALAGSPPEESNAAKAERLRLFVRDFVTTKDLAVGFATATEVARTAQGDCTEHGVLLAAMLRGEGIPSRTVSGLVYVDGSLLGHKQVFGYHLWTQAWLPVAGGGAHGWVDLDATLQASFDATHIALSTSAMDDANLFNDLVRLAPFLGRLSIRVVEIGGS